MKYKPLSQSDRTAWFVGITMSAVPLSIVCSLIDKWLGIAIFLACITPFFLLMLFVFCGMIATIEDSYFWAILWVLFLLTTASNGWVVGLAVVTTMIAARIIGTFFDKWRY